MKSVAETSFAAVTEEVGRRLNGDRVAAMTKVLGRRRLLLSAVAVAITVSASGAHSALWSDGSGQSPAGLTFAISLEVIAFAERRKPDFRKYQK